MTYLNGLTETWLSSYLHSILYKLSFIESLVLGIYSLSLYLYFCRWAVLRTCIFRLPNPGFTTRQSHSVSPSFARLAQSERTEANLNNWLMSPEPGWPRRRGRNYCYRIKEYVSNWSRTELQTWNIRVEIASNLWSGQHEFESQLCCVDFEQITQFLHGSASCDLEQKHYFSQIWHLVKFWHLELVMSWEQGPGQRLRARCLISGANVRNTGSSTNNTPYYKIFYYKILSM